MKYMPAIFLLVSFFFTASLEAAELHFSGSLRTRFEALEGQYRATGSQSDQQLTTRATFRTDYNFRSVDLVAEIMDSSAFLTDTDSTLNNSMVNTLEPLQVYVAYRPDADTRLVAGRYTLDLGSRRLVGRNHFRNTSNSFLGLLAERWILDKLKLTAFLNSPSILSPTQREPLRDNEREADDHTNALRFWGIHLTNELPTGNVIEGYLYGLNERDSSRYNTPDRRLKAGGIRYQSAADTNWGYGGEIIYQWGSRHSTHSPTNTTDLDVSAGLVHLEASYRVNENQQVRVAIDAVSGDRSHQDSAYNRFDTLYGPTVPDFGFTGIYGAISRANLISPEVRWNYRQENWTLFVAYRPVWLASRTDSFGRSKVRDVSGDSGRYAAQQIDTRFRIDLGPGSWQGELGLAYLRAEKFLLEAPGNMGNRNTVYSYGMLTYLF